MKKLAKLFNLRKMSVHYIFIDEITGCIHFNYNIFYYFIDDIRNRTSYGTVLYTAHFRSILLSNIIET